MMHGATNPEGEAPTTTKPATDTDAGTIERGRRDKPVRVGGGGGGIECGAAHKTGARGDKQDWWGLHTTGPRRYGLLTLRAVLSPAAYTHKQVLMLASLTTQCRL